MMSLVLTRLEYGNLAAIPLYLLKRLHSARNSASWLVFSSSRYDHITPLLHQLHWLKARERIYFKLALLVYTCQHGAALLYLADKLKTARRLPGSTSSAFRLFIVTNCPSYAVVNYQRPSLSGRRSSRLERSAAACHVCIITVCFPQRPQNTPH